MKNALFTIIYVLGASSKLHKNEMFSTNHGPILLQVHQMPGHDHIRDFDGGRQYLNQVSIAVLFCFFDYVR